MPTPDVVATHDFHPRRCALPPFPQHVVVRHRGTDGVVALYTSDVCMGKCFVTADVYEPPTWDLIYSKVRIAEAVASTKCAYITRVHLEPGWV